MLFSLLPISALLGAPLPVLQDEAKAPTIVVNGFSSVTPGSLALTETQTTVKIQVRNINPMLYQLTGRSNLHTVYPLPPKGQASWPAGDAKAAGGAPGDPASVAKAFKELPKDLVETMVKGDQDLLNPSKKAKQALTAEAFEAPMNRFAAAYEQASGEKIPAGAPLTQDDLLKIGRTIAGWPDVHLGQDEMELIVRQIWDVYSSGESYLAADCTVDLPAVGVRTDQAGEIWVEVEPRSYAVGFAGASVKGRPLAPEELHEGLTTNRVEVTRPGTTETPWSAAVLLSFATDGRYGYKGPTTGDANSRYAFKGTRDAAAPYIGTLYHFPLAGKRSPFRLSMGVGTNGTKLAYFLGPSYRLGSERSPGYLSIGAMAAQVDRPDGWAIGDVASDPSKAPSTRSVFKFGFGLGLSFRF